MNKVIRNLENTVSRLRKGVKPAAKRPVAMVAAPVAPILTKAEKREAVIFNVFNALEHERFLEMGALMLRTGR